MRRVRRERVHRAGAVRVGNLLDEGNMLYLRAGLRGGDHSPKPSQFKDCSTLPRRFSIEVIMPTRRSNFLSLSAGRGGTAGVVVVVAETVAMGTSVTSTIDEVEATGIGGAMTVAVTDRRGVWPVRC